MKKSTLSLAIGLISAASMAPAISQDASVLEEEVITLGTRAKPRSATDSPAPIDVINADELGSQGVTDMNDLFRNTVPSFNVNDQPISDAATLVRPANLRGMAPDHSLLLVNGKRRHRASVIYWQGNGISDGSQGQDLSSIPVSAISSVEVLRDGAAAQYGSDAIAGVINFQLNESAEGGAINFKYGQWAEGGEDSYTLSVNKGLPLGSDGFLNLTAEYHQAEPTNRAIQRADAIGLIADGYDDVPDTAMVWGTPEVEDDIKLFANFGIDITDSASFYGYGNHSTKTVEGGFYFRNPTNRSGVYGNGETLLIGALDGNRDSCPVVALDGNIPDPDAFQQVLDDPNCFSFQETIPGGFTPVFNGDILDQSLLAGFRGDAGDLTWDVSAYYGYHESDFNINNTLNASLGPDSPRDFDPGAYQQEDLNFNADFTYVLSDSVALAFGLEHREEEFTIVPGQEESYSVGVLGNQGFSTSSNGFPGFSPSISGSWKRKNNAAYLDVEYDATDNLLLTGAIRVEDFDDFGTTENFKIGGNWRINDYFGVRSTISTGFKAPTPGQANASNITTFATSDGQLINEGVIPATSAVAQAVGARPLGPEESESVAFGIYLNVGSLDLTVDYFNIDVSDRLNLSANNSLNDEQREQLIAEGVSGVNDISEFKFFTNDFDTNTSGVDIVASFDSYSDFGSTTYSFAFNYTKTDVTDFNPATVNATRIRKIEETTPDTRWAFTINHQIENLRILGRASYYGEFYDGESDGIFYGAYTYDLEAAYSIGSSSTVTIGGSNIFGEQGCSLDDCSASTNDTLGQVYSQYSPFGFNGALWYAKYQFSF